MDEDGNALPVMAVRMAHDNGSGEDADYGGRVTMDHKIMFTFDGGVFVGAQTGGSGEPGATRLVVIGSEKDERLKTDAASSTVTEGAMLVSLWNAVVYTCRQCVRRTHFPFFLFKTAPAESRLSQAAIDDKCLGR